MSLRDRHSELIFEEDEGDILREAPRWKTLLRRVVLAILAFWFVTTLGAILVFLTGRGDYRFADAFFFALISISTVGYGELPDMSGHAGSRVVAGAIVVFGLVVIAVFQSTLTAFFVEGAFGRAFRKRRMDKKIREMNGHFIVVGCGRVGRYVAKELHLSHQPYVVLERNPDAVHHLESELHSEVVYIEGDATDDEVLKAAGIEHAQGLVTSLSLDRDNLFVTLSARTMNPELRIVAKVSNSENERKLLRAGASTTVSPQQIGGRRLASELVRPQATAFLDSLLHLPEAVRFHELEVHSTSRLQGSSLREARLRDIGDVLVVGIRLPDGTYRYNPGPEERLIAGSRLIILGKREEVQSVEAVL
jgi:voltage-gated potassium channel